MSVQLFLREGVHIHRERKISQPLNIVPLISLLTVSAFSFVSQELVAGYSGKRRCEIGRCRNVVYAL